MNKNRIKFILKINIEWNWSKILKMNKIDLTNDKNHSLTNNGEKILKFEILISWRIKFIEKFTV